MFEAITTAQKEAFLNEYKGSLFEFLVASELWQRSGADLAQQMPFALTVAAPQLELLQQQEQWLRRLDSQLLCALPVMAEEVALKILQDLNSSGYPCISDIKIIGENSSGKSDWNEGDLLLLVAGEWRPISLKLCKAGTFVNTKSAGAKSFLSKYFAYYFSSRPLDVRQFSQQLEFHFTHMAHLLHQLKGLDYQGNWQAWQDLNLPTLPGQLAAPERQIVLNFYHSVIEEMRGILEQVYNSDPAQFIAALAPIMGQGRQDMQQYLCFYRHQADKRYQVQEVMSLNHHWLTAQTRHIQFMPAKAEIASFEIKLKQAMLQIRLKPMNTFTVPSLKVNCSVRYG